MSATRHVLFEGGGEMGRRMSELDWTKTPLGPVDGWPESLKTCVRIVLTSRQPMFVWWGPELINLYNDAYRAIVGGKHPQALAQPASVVWREIWEQVGPRAESTMRGNVGTYDEALLLIMERHGYKEETYYTFSYSPVPGEAGQPGGLICANTDDTERIVGERQLALLRELAARTADARTVQQACALSAACLASDAWDLPFAMIYLADAERRELTLAETAGIARDHAAAGARVSFEAERPLPFREVRASGETYTLRGAEAVLGALPKGPWPDAANEIALVPIASLGGKGQHGVLVVGLNPFRHFDDKYARFLSLVAGQISASIGNAAAYEQERKRTEELQELDRAKTAFFSNVSHEFRTPLTLMLGPLEESLADNREPLSAAQHERIAVVHRNGLRLLRLVNALLDFSRIEAGRMRAAFVPTDLAAFTRDLASNFRAAVEKAGLVFVIDCPRLPDEVFVDCDLWEKIVFNLLSNALKFTFDGTITLSLRERAGSAVLSVIDTGIGISDRDLPRIFERFGRIEGARSRSHEGTGIGLALVQELVKMHGGRLEVESAVGRGTTFRVTLPFGKEHLAEQQVSTRARRDWTPSRGAAFVEEALRWSPDAAEATDGVAEEVDSGIEIVLADDNADMRDYLARLLGRRWKVRSAGDGLEALALVRERRPTLIVTDVMMPVLDGLGLVRELRADPMTRSIPIVMLSARAGEEARIEGLEAGVDDYVVKPFSARELVARVATRIELLRLGTRLEQERAAISNMFEHAPLPVAILRGRDLVFDVANPAYIAVIGRDVRGLPLAQALPELYAQGFAETIQEVMRSGVAAVGREEPLLLERNGRIEETFWTFIYARLGGERGEDGSVVVVCTDVTLEVQARKRMEALAAEADAANRAKDEFMAMLGHELRNPLSPIITALELMRLRGTKSREQEVIERQVGHLTRLVDDLLDVSRITRGKVEIRKEASEIAKVVGTALEVASPLLEQRRHRVEVEVPRLGLVVDVDPQRMAQVISNLLTNAAKYSDPGSTIWVRAARVADVVYLSVADQGVGIAPDMLTRVFELFVQQPQTIERSKGGLGLGLTIVRSLVELHGGRVSARSDGAGKGSEFVVELPALDEAVPYARHERLEVETQSARGRKRKRILVVDDNEDAARTLTDALAELGYEVERAHDGPTALERANAFQPNIALLDIGLPVMDGYELAQRLRGLANVDPSLLLVAITGYGQNADRVHSEHAGFAHHLVKPLDFQRLRRIIEG